LIIEGISIGRFFSMKKKAKKISKNKEVLVIWPSDDVVKDRNVDPIKYVINNGKAIGYAGRADRANSCEFVIITSGRNMNPRKHFIAEIIKATPNSRLLNRSGKRDYPTFDLNFKNSEEFKSEILDKHKWGSRNTRYWAHNKLI